MRFASLVPAVAAAAALSVLAAGCGGSGSPAAATGATTTVAGATSAGTGATTTARSGTGAFSAADQAQLEKYRACLQKQGVDFGGFGFRRNGGSTTGRPPANGTTTRQRPTLTPAQQAARTKAFNACRSLAPSGFQFGRPGAGQNGQQGGQYAAYRACMQQHGITFAAPGSTQQPSFNTKKFQAATKACGHLLTQAGQGATTTTGSG